jgi:hypothetical protein
MKLDNQSQIKTSIVFIHNKKSSYMAPVIKQAKLSNPDADIFIISNICSKKFYEKYGKFIDINDYFNEASAFEKLYFHLSSLDYSLELIFIQRWFILKSFMKINNLEYVVYLDSDCMLYHNVSSDWHYLNNYDFANLDKIWPSVTFFPNVLSISKFCDFLIFQYKNNLDYLKIRYKEEFLDKNIEGGIGDMSHFGMYHDKYNNIFDLSIIINNSTYDTNINDSINSRRNFKNQSILAEDKDGYLFNSILNIKKIIINDKKPYGFLRFNNKKIQFKSIHFQGSSKKYIPYFYTGNIFEKIIFIRMFRKLRY